MARCRSNEAAEPMSDAHFDEVDLVLDLNSEDESGLPWSFIDEARDPSAITEGGWIIVGERTSRAVAQIAEVEGNVVRVRPLPGPVDRHRHLLRKRTAWQLFRRAVGEAQSPGPIHLEEQGRSLPNR